MTLVSEMVDQIGGDGNRHQCDWLSNKNGHMGDVLVGKVW